MREKAIEAMAAAWFDARELSMPERCRTSWAKCSPQARAIMVAQAAAAFDAAIATLSEPDEAMMVAGMLAPNYLEDQSSRRGCVNILKAMLQEAAK